MSLIDQMVSSQPGLIPQVTGYLTHTILWAANLFVNHYFDYYYVHIIRGTSAEETIWSKDAYKRLPTTQGSRFCAYRAENGRFAEP